MLAALPRDNLRKRSKYKFGEGITEGLEGGVAASAEEGGGDVGGETGGFVKDGGFVFRGCFSGYLPGRALVGGEAEPAAVGVGVGGGGGGLAVEGVELGGEGGHGGCV